MARYEITGPDGARYEITAPDGASEKDVLAFVQSQTGAKQPQTGALKAAALGASQGLTFGFGDELYGAGKGAVSAITGGGFSDAYAKGRDEARAAQKQAAADQPVAYYGGEIAGGVALPFGAARVAGVAARAAPAAMEPVAGAARTLGFGQLAANSGANLGARTVAGVREGAAYGAAYGLGQGEGGVAERAANSASGAALGGAFGAAAPALVDGVSAVARGLSTPVRAAMNPQAVGREKLAEALMRDVSGEAAAQPGYREAFQRLTNRMDAADDAGKNMMLADFGGENTRNLLRSAANTQSTGAERLRKRLDTRQGNQWHRINVDVDRHLGGLDYGAQNTALAAQQADDAGRAYGAAYNTPVSPAAATQIVEFIGSRPYMQRLYDLTQQNVRGMRGTNADLNPWEMLHRTRMQIDTQLRNLRSGQPDPVANWTANDLQRLRTEFSGLLGTHNGRFRAANERFADQEAILNAAEDGFDTFKNLPLEQLAERMQQAAQAGPAVAQAFRRGSGRAIIGDVMRGNVTRDRTENIFSSPDMQQRLEIIFPTRQQFREFQRSLVLEAKMADTRKAVQGGPTTAKQLAQADEAGQPMRMAVGAAQAATGRLEPAFNMLTRQAQRFSGLTPSSANAIINAAMERNPREVRRALQEAIRQAGNVPEARARLAQELIGGATAAGTGSP
jgi:hypothetical protein